MSAITSGALVLAAASLLVLAVALLAAPSALAHPPKGDQPARPAQNTMTRPLANVPPGLLRIRSKPAPGAGLVLPPRLGQIPSVAGGIPRLDAAGFAPDMPVFQALQPELPAAGPPPRHRGRGQGRGRGRGRGWDWTPDQGAEDGGEGRKDCAEDDNGFMAWRRDCGD